jgi:hypothetical protein
MAIGTGQSHWAAGLVGREDTPYDELAVDLVSRRFASATFMDFILPSEATNGATSGLHAWVAIQLLGATGTAVYQQGEPNGVLRITAGAVDNAGVAQFMHNGTVLQPSTTDSLSGLANRITAFGARFAVQDFSLTSWFFGIGTFDATFMAAGGNITATGADNMVGFHHIAGASGTQGSLAGPDGNDVRMVSAGGGVANYQTTMLSAGNVSTSPVPSNAAIDGIFREYAVKVIGLDKLEFYVNGVLRHRRAMGTALAASTAMAVMFANVNTETSADNNLDVDTCWFGSTR